MPLESFSGLDFLAKYSYTDSSIDDNSRAVDNTRTRNYATRSQTDSNIVSLAADWYVTKSWAVGAGYLWGQYDAESEYTNIDDLYRYSNDGSDCSYSISTAYWWQISDLFAAKFSAAKHFAIDGDDTDGFMVGISANARF